MRHKKPRNNVIIGAPLLKFASIIQKTYTKPVPKIGIRTKKTGLDIPGTIPLIQDANLAPIRSTTMIVATDGIRRIKGSVLIKQIILDSTIKSDA